jgi:CelD/BcsL family acetyltransferase involved in cellulose biosynthesis
MQVCEINRFDELADQRPAWDRLWSRTRGASFFHSFGWFNSYWRHYGASQKLRAMVISDANDVVAIVPLVVRTEPTRLGPVRVLTYPLHDWGSFYGPVGAEPQAILPAALQTILSTPRNWDLLDLRWIDPQLDRGATLAAMTAAGFTADEQLWGEASVVEASAGWQAYWSSRTSRWRNNVNRCERKLAQEGRVTYQRYRSPPNAEGTDPRWELYEACLAVAGQSWQSTATNGTTLTHGEIQQFLRDAHAAAASVGAIDINLLYLDERPVAFAYNYAHDGWIYGLRTGYDAGLSRSGAGTVLLARMIRDSCDRGDRSIDLGVGYLQTKRHWLTSVRPIHRCTHFPATAPKAQILRLKRWLNGQWSSKQVTRSDSSTPQS